MHVGEMVKVIDGKRYNTAKSTVIADDCYWDGHNFERHGRNTFLLRTPGGNYFQVTRSQWQGEVDKLTPMSQEQAIAEYESMPEQNVPFEEAFPGVTVVDA